MHTNTKHTPGPWKMTFAGMPNGTRYLSALTDSTGHEWARIEQSPLGKGGDELEANARLIAAAPELLAALRMASVLLWKNSKALCHPNPQDIDEAFEAMRAAIAKATGPS